MNNIDTIELKNINLEKDEDSYSYGNVTADVYVNGKCNTSNGYCELSTFLADSHHDEGEYNCAPYNKKNYKNPNKNFISYYSYKEEKNDFSLTEEQKASLPKNKYFRAKKKNKLIKENKRKAILNENYLVDRVYRNEYFQNIKKHSHYYLDTCSCGHAGCAGIWNGVTINRKGSNMIYTAPDAKKNGYTHGILGSGKNKLVISLDNLEIIRKQLKPLFNK